MKRPTISPLHILAGIPGGVVLLLAAVLAWSPGAPTSGPALTAKMDVGRARTSLLTTVPVGTPIEAALGRLRDRNLTCTIVRPPLANLTWPVITCLPAASPTDATLKIDVAGRNGVVADIGVEDVGCRLRADSADPSPRHLDCDMSSQRQLALDAKRRHSESAFLAEVLLESTQGEKPRR